MKAAGTIGVAALLCLLAASTAALAVEASTRAGGSIDNTVAWEGRVLVERGVTVSPGAVLTIRPGTTVLFRKGTGLGIEGRLVAKGTREAPIRFESAEEAPARGDWEGIRFPGGEAASVLERCIVRHAATAVLSVGGSPAVRDCELEGGNVGIVATQKGSPLLAGNTIRDMTETGIACDKDVSPTIERNVIRSCSRHGIFVARNSAPVLRENVVEECGNGLFVEGTIPPVTGNTFRKNRVGMATNQSGKELAIRGNRFDGNEVGLRCDNFSFPLVARNEWTGNGDAIVCYQSSGPYIRNNRIEGNRRGIFCSRLSNARIVGNDIRGNDKGIVLTLSSYAVVNGNNIDGNGVQMELENMSADWERRVGRKPERGVQARVANLVSRGRVSRPGGADSPGDGATVMDAVDATGNWWGEKDTEEMERKGPDANIGGLVDYHDVPVRTYEGYPGEYLQDRIRYDGWRKSRVPDAGIPAGGKESGG